MNRLTHAFALALVLVPLIVVAVCYGLLAGVVATVRHFTRMRKWFAYVPAMDPPLAQDEVRPKPSTQRLMADLEARGAALLQQERCER